MTLTVSTPSHLWAVLFLRDLGNMEVAQELPRCAPIPHFAPLAREVRPDDAHLVRDAWTGTSMASVGTKSDFARVMGLVAELGQQDPWREWSTR